MHPEETKETTDFELSKNLNHNHKSDILEEYDYLQPEFEKSGSTNSLQTEFYDIKASVERINESLESLENYNLKSNRLQNQKISPNKVNQKSIKDSFGSYYSKDDSIDNQNNINFSNQDISRRTEIALLKEIDVLRQENQYLRKKMLKSPSGTFSTRKTQSPHDIYSLKVLNKRPVSPISRGRSKSPNRVSKFIPISPRPITPSRATPNRLRHCKTCDHLLSKGYSTKYCSKHGSTTRDTTLD